MPPMLTPPKPTFAPDWFTCVQRYQFVPVAADSQIGTLADTRTRKALVIAAGPAHGSCTWGFVDGEAKASYLLSRATYEALRSASLDASGALMVNGRLCHLQANFSGEAELVPAMESAS